MARRTFKSLTPKVTAFKGTKPGELKLGKAGKFKLAPNDEIQSYIRSLGERLVPESQKKLPPGDPNRIPFQFYVGEQKYPNAFATANGVVVVLTPMLALAKYNEVLNWQQCWAATTLGQHRCKNTPSVN